jgi:hypothetical protein
MTRAKVRDLTRNAGAERIGQSDLGIGSANRKRAGRRC